MIQDIGATEWDATRFVPGPTVLQCPYCQALLAFVSDPRRYQQTQATTQATAQALGVEIDTSHRRQLLRRWGARTGLPAYVVFHETRGDEVVPFTKLMRVHPEPAKACDTIDLAELHDRLLQSHLPTCPAQGFENHDFG